jgi:hypothetical protein
LPAFPGNLESLAVIKALQALKGQNVNYAQAFAEREQTARLFSDCVRRIAKTVRRYKHARPKDWLRVLRRGGAPEGRKVPQSWLELQYGWKPLMQDVHGACSDLNNRERSQDAYHATVHGRTKERHHFADFASCSQTAASGVNLDVSLSFDCLVRLDYQLDSPVVATLNQWGITNPVSLAWELVPYSFVVDWFVPVGDYLSCLDADFGWTFLAGSVTKFTRYTEQGVSARNGVTPAGIRYVIAGSPALMNTKMVYMGRETYDSSPLPRFPGFKNPLSTGHIANAMSLLVSAFR